MKELCSTKDAAAANEQRLGAELSTVWFAPSLTPLCLLPYFMSRFAALD